MSWSQCRSTLQWRPRQSCLQVPAHGGTLFERLDLEPLLNLELLPSVFRELIELWSRAYSFLVSISQQSMPFLVSTPTLRATPEGGGDDKLGLLCSLKGSLADTNNCWHPVP